ncbi:hypothetical protein Tsubulata_011307 [Turnera subulata]|uniref:U-box domain-containing protein n=1 Tax=Turnera subulata TaxID=218843 RepID=A0A9Q0FV36_9ROSI|nr:hypothetical protein Tsubulata_011307 [Turnera subulata]
MVRDNLYITIPSYFRCPISLDVMKSPVSLCTGVTYDRASIQRWLDGGNNTCPATMQVLHTKDFVPNRNLQRLIQIWSDSTDRRRGAAAADPAISRDQVREVVRDIRARRNEASFCSEALSKVMSFAKESEEKCEFVANLDGLVPMLVEFLGGGDNGKRVGFLERVVNVLALLLIKIEDSSSSSSRQLRSLFFANGGDLDNKLSSLALVFKNGTTADSRIAAVKILESIAAAVDVEAKLTIAEMDGLLSGLVESLTLEADQGVTEAILSCLVAISKPKRVRLKLVELKVVKRLTKLLAAPGGGVSVAEKALMLLEAAASCREGRAEVCGDEECVAAVTQKVLKVSGEATEHAVTILWSVCYLFRDKAAQEVVARCNGLTKILLLMQSNCSPAVRQMSADLLKIFRVNSKNSFLSCYDTKTTHIMPF